MIPHFEVPSTAVRLLSYALLSLVVAACGGTGGGSSSSGPAVVNLSASASSVVEGDVGTKQVSITLTLSAQPTNVVTVDYQTQDDAAVAGADYTATSGTLTFAQGVQSAEVVVTILSDVVDEGSEESFRLMLSNPTDGVVLTRSQIDVIITDDDTANAGSADPQLSVVDASAPEASGTVDFTVLLSRSSSTDVTLNYSATAGTATANDDFTAATGVVTIAAGQTTATLSIATNNDNVDEDDETFTLTLSAANGATLTTPTAQGTIEDDDGAPEISISDISLTEGDAGTSLAQLSIELSSPSERELRVDYATFPINASAGTDYQTNSGTLIIPAGLTSSALTIEIVGDTEVESSEGFFVEFSNAQNARLANATANVTIVDDDNTAGTLADLSFSSGIISESGQSDLEVVLSAAVGSDVVVTYTVVPQSATLADLVTASGSVTISAGSTSASLSLAAVDDDVDEPQESFVVSISTNNTDVMLTNPNGTVRLNDNDSTPVLSIANQSVAEGNAGTTTATIQASLSHPSSQAVTFNGFTANGSATAGLDYVAVSRSYTIPALSTALGLDIEIIGDSIFEGDESFTVRTSNPTNATIASGSATVSITDNDNQPSLSVADTSAAEDEGQIQFTVSLAGTASNSASVNYALTNGTASAGSDYTNSSGTLTFPAGTTSVPVLISISDDNLVESDETFNLILSSPSNASIADGSATATIVDNDVSVTPTVSIADASITEGNSGSQDMPFTLTLSSSSTNTVNVDYSTTPGSATAGTDYTSRSGTVTFAAGSVSQTVNIPILGDTLSESSEQFTVTLSAASGATLADASAFGTIQDNDGASSLSVTGGSQNEGTGANPAFNFVVSLAPASASTVSVNYATVAGSATASSDFVARNGTLTFAPGETSKDLAVQIVADSLDEANESFSLSLSSASNASIGVSSATLTIIDDDAAGPGPVGLSSRPSNTSCVAPAEIPGGGAGTVSVVKAFPNLPDDFVQTIGIRQSPNDTSNFFVFQRLGAIRRFENTASVSSAPLYLQVGDIYGGNEGGLLGLAFHPNWPTVKELFVSYTTNPGATEASMQSRISRLIIQNDSSLPATFTEQILLTVGQDNSNHNGGDLHFGPDGNLYVGFGDGGLSGDPQGYGQNTTRLLSSMVRIDVVGVSYPSPGYNIPSGNPFAGNSKCGPDANASNCPEIYAWGFRNPWRFSFDAPTNRLWLADVGQNSYEEVNLVTQGSNYGWRCREGAHDFNTSGCGGGFTDPIHEYGNDTGGGNKSITGGYVYRGTDAPSLAGKYVFGDYASGRIWTLTESGGNFTANEVIDTALSIGGFGQGADGEIYIVPTVGAGGIYKFAESGGGGGSGEYDVPNSLANTGCFQSANPQLPTSGLVDYEPAASFWSDGASKERWVALPNGADITAQSNGEWIFPNGTVLAKHFRLQNQLIETRLMMRHPDGAWRGYTYEWNSGQTAATRVVNGKNRTLGSQTWVYPSESECLSCHTSVSNFALGLETAQLNTNHTYASTGITDNQIETFNHIDMFAADLSEPVSGLPALVDPTDNSNSLTDRARAYLHTNCAQCHQPNGPTGTSLDMRYSTSLQNSGMCAAPTEGSLGISNALIIAPGDSTRSVLVARMNTRDANAMPPLGSNVVDSSGVNLMSTWINSLASCP